MRWFLQRVELLRERNRLEAIVRAQTAEIHRLRGETPHCAGRTAVAHKRTAMEPVGWKCPVCGEGEDGWRWITASAGPFALGREAVEE